MTRDQIKSVQERLNKDLPDMPLLSVDGIDGPKTRSAVSAWQQRRGLKITSSVNDVWLAMAGVSLPKRGIFPTPKQPFPRNIKYLAFHCSATQPEASVESMQQYWKSKGWKRNGYHAIVLADGTVKLLEPLEVVSNGVANYNSVTINICYVGGIDRAGKPADTRTEAQKKAQLAIAKELRSYFPNAIIRGHRDFPNVPKACPSFDTREWFKSNGIDPK